MANSTPAVSSPLVLDPAEATARIVEAVRMQLASTLKRRGLVVGMSSGVDSSVSAALAVRAVGPKHVFGIFMPERESDPDSLRIAKALADQLGIESTTEDIYPVLQGAGCYQRRNDAIRRVVPAFKDNWGCKLVLPADRLEADRLNVTYLVVQAPGGEQQKIRLPAAEYRQIVAASNFKQRVRKMMEYYHADRLHYAVIGTPNRLEYDQGFFVKGGDGLADVKPIAHLYKSQVYQLAEYLGIPEPIRRRRPTTDTYPLEQSQEEFFFGLTLEQTDLCLYAKDHGVPPEAVGEAIGLPSEYIERAFGVIDSKRRAAQYLHMPPVLNDEGSIA
jgi:NAD+ synthase